TGHEHRKAGRLHTRHQQDRRGLRAGRAPLDEAVERRQHRRADHAPLAPQRVPYSGINILMVWASAIEQGFAAPIWMTFKQAIELDAHVRKGEKGSLVVYANSITKTEDDGSDNEVEREIPFMKGYTVFNVEQIEGLPAIYYTVPEVKLTTVERIERAEAFFA